MSMDKGIGIEPVIGFANDYKFVDYIKAKIPRNLVLSQKVSVIIPFYERIEEITLVLKSLVNQTLPPQNIDVLICDDGSSDATLSELFRLRQSYVNLFRDIQILTQEKDGFGLTRARNMGMREAYTDYIVIIDCDILPMFDMLEKHLQNLLVSDKVLSIGFRTNKNFKGVSADNLEILLDTPIPKEKLDWRIPHFFRDEQFETTFKLGDTYWMVASGGNIGFHRNVMDQGFLFDESFKTWGCEDTEWGYRLYKAGFYFYPAFDATAYHIEGLQGFQAPREEGRKISMEILKDKCPKIDCSFATHPKASVPLVTFFVTCFNRSAYIKDTLNSIKKFYWSYEVLLIDDGSTDDSVKQALSVEGVNLKVISTPHRGIAYAYAEAIKHAKGEFIIQIDSDDFFNPSGFVEIKNMIAQMFDKPVGLLYGSYSKYKQDGSYLEEGWRFPYSKRNMNLFGGMFVHPTRICRKRELSRMDSLNLELKAAVDYDMYSKVLEISYGAFLDSNFYCYRQHTSNLSKELSQEQSSSVSIIVRDRLSRMGALSYVNIEMLTKHFCLTQHKTNPNTKIYASTRHLGLTSTALEILIAYRPTIDMLVSPEVFLVDKHQSFITYQHEGQTHVVDASVRQIGLFKDLQKVSPSIRIKSYLLDPNCTKKAKE